MEADAVEVAEAVAAEMESTSKDRVGLGWRTELAAGIFAHRDRIDVVEVIAEDWFDAPRQKLSALRMLATQIPLQLHGTSAGLASAEKVEEKRLAKMARLVDFVQPECWSEHLAFVRAGGWEIGHLAAVPRNGSTVADAAANIDRARRIVGSAPMVENISTLIAPLASSLTEPQWLKQVAQTSNAPLLLDLHNLYANTVNFGGDLAACFAALRDLPLQRVGAVHIAGGRWLSVGPDYEAEMRWLDDHLHPVPDPVFALLEELSALVPQPLTVILERDGAYPQMEDLLCELDFARTAMKRGRMRRVDAPVRDTASSVDLSEAGTYSGLEKLLASVYMDETTRASLLSEPEDFARRHRLSHEDCATLAAIDRTGLAMAARSFARKRHLKRHAGH